MNIKVKWLKAHHIEETVYLYWVFQKGKTKTNGWDTQREVLQPKMLSNKIRINKLPETSSTWMTELFQKE